MSSGRMIGAFHALIFRSGPLTAASPFVQHFSFPLDGFRQILQRRKIKIVLREGTPLRGVSRQSKILPWAQNSLCAHFCPMRSCWGVPSPNPACRRKLHIPRFAACGKARPFRCSSSPHRKRSAGLHRGPHRGLFAHFPNSLVPKGDHFTHAEKVQHAPSECDREDATEQRGIRRL